MRVTIHLEDLEPLRGVRRELTSRITRDPTINELMRQVEARTLELTEETLQVTRSAAEGHPINEH